MLDSGFQLDVFHSIVTALHQRGSSAVQGVQRVKANLDDTCLDSPNAKHQFAEVAAAAAKQGMADAFSSSGEVCLIKCFTSCSCL